MYYLSNPSTLGSRSAILDLYKQLHAHHVIHGDVDPRHWLRRPDGTWSLIDFDCAEIMHAPDGEARREIIRGEMFRVREFLDLDTKAPDGEIIPFDELYLVR